MNTSTEEKRVRINKLERNHIEEDLRAYRMINSLIKDALIQKIPKGSINCLKNSSKSLEDLLLKDGLPECRIEEIKNEIHN